MSNGDSIAQSVMAATIMVGTVYTALHHAGVLTFDQSRGCVAATREEIDSEAFPIVDAALKGLVDLIDRQSRTPPESGPPFLRIVDGGRD